MVKSKHKLKDHCKSHTQEKVVACPTCGALFSCRTKFFDHLTRQAGYSTGMGKHVVVTVVSMYDVGLSFSTLALSLLILPSVCFIGHIFLSNMDKDSDSYFSLHWHICAKSFAIDYAFRPR